MDTKISEAIPEVEDQRLILNGVSWQEYEVLGALFPDRPGLRMTYLEGTLELMSPSPEHEAIKTMIARLLEAYAEEMGMDLNGYGSTTFKEAAEAVGAEPDECYCIGALRDVPDFAIEIVATKGGINKLAVYAGLRVPEVWFWKKGQFSLFRLTDQGYTAIEHSAVLPDLDLTVLSAHIDTGNQTRAVKAFRQAIR